MQNPEATVITLEGGGQERVQPMRLGCEFAKIK